MKDHKQWDTRLIEHKAQARVQGVEDVLNPGYTPHTTDDKENFVQKQRYTFFVYTKTLQTDKGKFLVRRHENDYDAHIIHKELIAHAQRSTKASVDTLALLTYITSARLGTGVWKGSSESFIIHRQNQVQKYDKLVHKADCFSDSIKRTMLENDVQVIQDFRGVRNQTDQFQVRLGTKISYDQYCSLLLSAT